MKHIIWDFDGTLFDTYPAMVYAFKKALDDSGINEKEENIVNYMKVSVSCAIKYFSEKYKLKDDFVQKFLSYEKNIDASIAKPFPYAIELCRGIMDKGGKNYIFTHRGNSTLKFLKYYNMVDYFTEIVTKHNGFKRKPDPEAFLYLVEKYNMDKDKTFVVGDREFEVLGAKAAGIKSCLYDTNNIILNEIPDFKINSLKELYKILDL